MEVYGIKKIRTSEIEHVTGKTVALYEESITNLGECTLALARCGDKKRLIAKGSGRCLTNWKAK